MASMLEETSYARAYLDLMRQDPAVADDPEFADIIRHAMAEAKIPLSFDIRSSATMADVQSAVRKAKHAVAAMGADLKLVVVDYLNLMTASGRYHGNKVQEVGEILRALKAMAKRENVALLVLAQLNRQSTNQEGQAERPTMAHLRDSGEIEMHADTILFAFREAYNLERTTYEELSQQNQRKLRLCRNDLELIVAKKRMGRTGSVTLWCDLSKNVVKDHPYATSAREVA
jgi:replicative DNA helicase